MLPPGDQSRLPPPVFVLIREGLSQATRQHHAEQLDHGQNGPRYGEYGEDGHHVVLQHVLHGVNAAVHVDLFHVVRHFLQVVQFENSFAAAEFPLQATRIGHRVIELSI